MILEVGVNIRVRAVEDGGRCSPVAWLRATRRDIRGNAASREEPDLDCIGFPFQGINTTTSGIEIGAITGSTLIEGSTTGCVVICGIGIVLAVISIGSSSLVLLKHLECIAGVQSRE